MNGTQHEGTKIKLNNATSQQRQKKGTQKTKIIKRRHKKKKTNKGNEQWIKTASANFFHRKLKIRPIPTTLTLLGITLYVMWADNLFFCCFRESSFSTSEMNCVLSRNRQTYQHFVIDWFHFKDIQDPNIHIYMYFETCESHGKRDSEKDDKNTRSFTVQSLTNSQKHCHEIVYCVHIAFTNDDFNLKWPNAQNKKKTFIFNKHSM